MKTAPVIHVIATFSVACLLLSTVSCGGSGPASSGLTLKGAGASFPALAYNKWLEEYKVEKPSVAISYDSAGSETGIKRLIAGEIDFAGTDIPFTEEQMAGFSTRPLHFPSLAGAVVVTYNIPGFSGTLNFTPETLARIFEGKIKTWQDPAIRNANPGVTLPATPVTVIHRTDGSGTTYVFTSYLSQVSETWRKDVGSGAAVKWPAGKAAQSSEELASMVEQTPGAIGYVELNYALKHKLTSGAVQNQAGKFQRADFESLGAAIDSIQQLPKDFRMSITNAPGERAYPIATFTYIVVPSRWPDVPKREAMKGFLRWILNAGQKSALQLDYSILTPGLVEKVREQVGDLM
jgi:phosphate transport system substrate-binding protein